MAVAAGCGGTTGESPAREARESGIVATVHDGDTLRLEDGRRVRLVQIDAPELPGDCYGRASRAALLGLAPPGSRVELERDPRLDGRDGYGRLLRYVLVAGRNVNVELVRAGAASPYFYRRQRGRDAEALLQAVREARDEGRGYWGACPRAELDPRLGSLTGPARVRR